ncbi:MAG TPA: succinyl-diaminopimelate desuccinylase [Gammaproteobacteria bacterium]
MSATLEFAKALIARPSVTPEDGGCQDVIAERLQKLGFAVERMDAGGVKNLWARYGKASPLFVFAGHTDVVPTGPEAEWKFPPFEPTEHDGFLYGRGAADMKGGLAAMITAVENFLGKHSTFNGSIAFLITSDEEGIAEHGTRHVMQELQQRGEKIDYCIVGEPSSNKRLGDVIRVGRRGSLNGVLTVKGVQGHVAYPEIAVNPIHRALGALRELTEQRWDGGFETFPPTSFQVSNIHAGTGADNVIPGELTARFNFRYCPEQTAQGLQVAVAKILDRRQLDWNIDWRESGRPFFTADGALTQAVDAAIREETGRQPEHSTGGGTSDGRFIAPSGAAVIELGVSNASIHQVNECVRIEELEKLSGIYGQVLANLLL